MDGKQTFDFSILVSQGLSVLYKSVQLVSEDEEPLHWLCKMDEEVTARNRDNIYTVLITL